MFENEVMIPVLHPIFTHQGIREVLFSDGSRESFSWILSIILVIVIMSKLSVRFTSHVQLKWTGKYWLDMYDTIINSGFYTSYCLPGFSSCYLTLELWILFSENERACLLTLVRIMKILNKLEILSAIAKINLLDCIFGRCDINSQT